MNKEDNMISKGEFWKIMESYGAIIWPIQFILYFIALLMIAWLIIKPGNVQNVILKIYLAIVFAWNSLFFYLLYAKGMAGNSMGSYFNGFMFLLVSILFIFDIFKNEMVFILPKKGWPNLVTYTLITLVFLYPLLGIISGYNLSSLIMPGAYPCPTTAFAILVLIHGLPKINKVIFVILLFCAIPFTPFMQIAQYGVYEDIILFVSGIYGLIMLIRYWKKPKLQMIPEK